MDMADSSRSIVSLETSPGARKPPEFKEQNIKLATLPDEGTVKR